MSAAVLLVREALRDPVVREELRTIFQEDQDQRAANDMETIETIEPLIDAREAGRILGMSAAAVRAAAFRKTLPSVHVGRLLRFKSSELVRVLRR